MWISIRHSVLLFALSLLTACGRQDSSLDELDALIKNHQTVQEQYQARLDSIRAEYQYDQTRTRLLLAWMRVLSKRNPPTLRRTSTINNHKSPIANTSNLVICSSTITTAPTTLAANK